MFDGVCVNQGVLPGRCLSVAMVTQEESHTKG